MEEEITITVSILPNRSTPINPSYTTNLWTIWPPLNKRKSKLHILELLITRVWLKMQFPNNLENHLRMRTSLELAKIILIWEALNLCKTIKHLGHRDKVAKKILQPSSQYLHSFLASRWLNLLPPQVSKSLNTMKILWTISKWSLLCNIFHLSQKICIYTKTTNLHLSRTDM
jgi:hypothetical protein